MVLSHSTKSNFNKVVLFAIKKIDKSQTTMSCLQIEVHNKVKKKDWKVQTLELKSKWWNLDYPQTLKKCKLKLTYVAVAIFHVNSFSLISGNFFLKLLYKCLPNNTILISFSFPPYFSLSFHLFPSLIVFPHQQNCQQYQYHPLNI